MAIRFDGTTGEYAHATTGAFPTLNTMTIAWIGKVSVTSVRQQTFMVAEKGSHGVWVGFQGGYLRGYTYTGAMLFQLGPLVVGAYYGMAIVGAGGPGAWTSGSAVTMYLQRLDVLGPLTFVSAPYPNSSYTGTLTGIRFGESPFNEPLNGTVENVLVYPFALGGSSMDDLWASRSPTHWAAIDPPIRWWPMNGPALSNALVDTRASGNLITYGSLAYEAGFATTSTTFNDVLNEGVTLTDSWPDEHIDISSTQNDIGETVTPGDSYASTLIGGALLDETVTLTDSFRAYNRTPSPLLAAYYAGSSILSIGGALSSAQVRQGLFGRFTQAQFAGGGNFYRCIYLMISGPRENVGVYVLSQTTSSFTDVAIGWGAPINTLEPALADQTVGPAHVSFYPAATAADAVNGGDFDEDQWRALWIRYRVTGTDIILDDDFQLRVVST